MDKKTAVKNVTKFVVGFSTSAVVSQIVKNNVNPTTIPAKVMTVVAAGVIGYMAGVQAEKAVDTFIDETVAAWNEAETKTTAR